MLLVIPHPTINDLIMWPEARTGATGDLTSVSTHRPLPDSDPGVRGLELRCAERKFISRGLSHTWFIASAPLVDRRSRANSFLCTSQFESSHPRVGISSAMCRDAAVLPPGQAGAAGRGPGH